MASRPRSRSRLRVDGLAWSIGAALLAANGLARAAPAPDPAPEPTGSTEADATGGRTFALGDLDLPELGPDLSTTSETDLYLEVWRGGHAIGQVGQFRLRDGRLWATLQELRELGLKPGPELAPDADGRVPLDALTGLIYRYDVANQRVVFEVPASLRPEQFLGYREPAPVHANRGHGLMLNYDAYGRHLDDTTQLTVATDLRWFGRAGTLELTGLSRAGDDADGYQRLDTRWSYVDPNRMWTWTAGDLISGGLAWTRPMRMGGVQWRRNFAARPDLITYPMPRFAAQAAVPSSVELLVDNVRTFQGEVEDGPFVLDAFPHISGAGEATLVVRDALGRLTQTTVSIYSDTQRLARGLTDFSVEAGALRHGYATYDDHYDHDIAFSASVRHGITDTVTLEGHAEAAPDARVLGGGIVWSPLGRWGVVNIAAMHGGGDGDSGWLRSFGYQWTSRRVGFDLQSQRATAGYRDLASLDGAGEPMRQMDRTSFWLPIGRASLAYTWIRSRDADGERHRVQTLSWSQNLGHRASLAASVFHDNASGTGAGLSLSLPLGRDLEAGLSADHSAGQATRTVASLRRPVPYEGGWGWQVQGGHDGSGALWTASGTVRGRYGEATLGADRAAGRTGEFLQAYGGFVVMDGHVFAGRRIYDSFALVSSAGIAGVPVLHENRVLGRTDRNGYLVVPDVHGFQRNRIGIDPDRLGLDYRVPALAQVGTPADNGGGLVRFDIARVHPATFVLLDPNGQVVPAGTVARMGEQEVLVGFDGEAYVDDVKDGAVLELHAGSSACRYHLALPADDADAAPLACEATR